MTCKSQNTVWSELRTVANVRACGGDTGLPGDRSHHYFFSAAMTFQPESLTSCDSSSAHQGALGQDTFPAPGGGSQSEKRPHTASGSAATSQHPPAH